MTEAQTADDEENIIVLEGEDGNSYECQFINRFEFEGNDYALLVKRAEEGEEGDEDDDEEDEDSTLVIMRIFQRGSDFVFQTIETDDEFNRVVAFVEEMVQAEQEAFLAEQEG